MRQNTQIKQVIIMANPPMTMMAVARPSELFVARLSEVDIVETVDVVDVVDVVSDNMVSDNDRG